MNLFQVLILLFILFVIYKSIVRYLNKGISFWLMLLWILFWIGSCILAFFPVIIERTAFFLGIGRGVDLIIYIALFVNFYFLFKLSSKQDQLDKTQIELARKVALNNARKKDLI